MTDTPDVAFRPGYVVVSTSSATGGVRHQRTELSHEKGDDGSEQRRVLSDKHIDNGRIVRESEALVKKADYALKKHCTSTPFGWFCDKAALSGLVEEYAPLRLEADKLNRQAREVGSQRRVHVGYVAAKLVVDEFAAAEIGHTIVSGLTRFHEALRNGEVRDVKDAGGKVIKRDQVRAAEHAHANLARLAVGVSADILGMAIERVRPAKAEVVAAINTGKTPEAAGAEVDLGLIENAIHYFKSSLLAQVK